MIHKPITFESILDILCLNGYSPETMKASDGSLIIKFKVNDYLIYRIDPSQLPYLRMATLCLIDPNDDIDLMYQAAREVNEMNYDKLREEKKKLLQKITDSL